MSNTPLPIPTVTVTVMDIPTVTEGDLVSAGSSLRTVIMAVHSPFSAILSLIPFITPTFHRASPIHIALELLLTGGSLHSTLLPVRIAIDCAPRNRNAQ